MGEAVELIRDLGQGASAEEVVLLAVEVDAHEVHLHHVPDVLLRRFVAIEEAGLVVLSDCPSGDLIDLDAEGVAAVAVLAAQVDALDLDVDVI
jgi:hypothetical protein